MSSSHRPYSQLFRVERAAELAIDSDRYQKPALHFARGMAFDEDQDLSVLLERIAEDVETANITPNLVLDISYEGDTSIAEMGMLPVMTLAWRQTPEHSDAEKHARIPQRTEMIRMTDTDTDPVGFPCSYFTVTARREKPGALAHLLKKVAKKLRKYSIDADDVIAISYQTVWRDGDALPSFTVVFRKV